MAKNLNKINVNLSFNADTGKAKAQVKDLQDQLNKLINTTQKSDGLGINKDLEKSVQLVTELQAHLKLATNEDTGNLDFSKLNESLKDSGKSLQEYGRSLQKMGKDGYKAFQLLANSVVAAEVPIRRAHGALEELWVTMKNTMRWQITSSAMHGFMGAISTAYGYAQDLNESLNNIRIVSGQSVEQMADFAKEANKAAKILSTTTTDYTNAALIYYQQGLSDSEIKERTEITIKMANVARQSAEVVSDQLTAVWNNFYKEGDRALVYYADIMTALGAETASSTDEIAAGLEKFASIADMIGLSFEYAASSLATITATTRQSPEVVGTALKTIFARIQGLKLGETLEDGTDLNKYSDSLKRVGIDIFDTAGELKDMDVVLEEIGARWDSLATSEQVALAQAVAGVRQYNQLVSLMDNWDYFQENLGTARASEGALDEQAKIYAESWEAARDRTKAALESIYSKLLEDDMFIEALDSIGKILELIDKFIGSIGGLQGVLISLGAVLTKVFNTQLASSLKNAAYSMSMMTKNGRENVQKQKRTWIEDAAESQENKEYTTEQDKARSNSLKKQLELQEKMLANSSKMSEIEIATTKTLIERSQELGQDRIQKAEKFQTNDDNRRDLLFKVRGAVNKKDGEKRNDFEKEYENLKKNIVPTRIEFTESLNNIRNLETFNDKLELIKEKIKAIDDEDLNEFINNLEEADLQGENLEYTLSEIDGYLETAENTSITNLQNFVSPEEVELVENLAEATYNAEQSSRDYAESTRVEEEAIQHVSDTISNSIGVRETFADQIVNISNGIMSYASAWTSLRTSWESLQDPDLSGWEKFETVLTSLSMTIPMLIMGMQTLNVETIKNTMATLSNALAKKIYDIAVKSNIVSTREESEEIDQNTLKLDRNTLALLKNILVKNKKLLLAIGAIAVVAGGTLLFIKKLTEEYDKNATEAESAAEAAQLLSERYNELKNEALELKEAISNYDEAIEALDKLDKGTTAYAEALENANNKAKELIETYGLWSSASYDADGILKINPEKLKELQQDSENRERQAEKLYYGSQIREQQSALNAELTKARREFNAKNEGYSFINFTDEDFLEASNLISEAKKRVLESETETLEVSFKKAADATSYYKAYSKLLAPENLKIFEDFQSSIEKAKQANEYYTRELLKISIEESYGEEVKKYAKDDSEDGIDEGKYELALSTASAMTLRNNPDYQKDLENIDVSEINRDNLSKNYDTFSNIETTEQLARTYAEQILQVPLEQLKKYKWEHGELINSEGEKLLSENLTYKEMAQQLARSEEEKRISDKYAKDIQNESNTVGSIIDQGKLLEKNYGFDSSNIILSSIVNGEGKIDLSSIFKELSPEEYEKLYGLDDEGLAKIFGFNPENFGTDSEFFKKTGFSNATDFADKARESLRNWDENDYIKSRDKQGEARAKEYDLDLEEFKSYRDLLIEANKEYRNNREAANEIAIANKRLEKGVIDLGSDWEDYNKIMSDTSSSSAEVSKVLKDIKPAVQNILNLDNETFNLLPESFFQDNWQLVQDVMNGVEGSVDTLRDKAGEEILFQVGANVDIDKDGKMDQAILDLHNKIAEFNNNPKFKVNELIKREDEEAFYTSCQNIIDAAKMTSADAQKYFGQMGYDVTFKDNPQTIEERVTEHKYTYDYDDDGNITYRHVEPIFKTVKTTVDVPTIETITPNGNYGGDINVETTPPESAIETKSGGNTTKATKTKVSKKSDIVDRYKEINDELDEISDELEDISKISNRLYGAKKIAALEKEATALLKQKEALKEKKKQALEYLKIDKQALELEAKKHGITFEFDTDGNITNYTSQLTPLYEELKAAQEKMNTFSTKEAQDKYEESTLKPIQEKIDELKSAILQYDTTKKEVKDLQNLIDDAYYKWQDNNYEKLTYSLELKLEINDMELERIDYYLNKFSDNFYKMAESAALMFSQIAPNKQSLEDNQNFRKELEQKYNSKDKEISQADYIDGLKTVRENLYNNLEALNELDKTMLHYYEDTLSAATEELSDYTDHMEHLTGVFDHYLNLMNLLGRQKDYDAIGNFLGGKAETVRDRLDVAKEYYNTLLEQKNDVEAKLNAAIARGDDAAIELYKEEWDAIVDAVDSAQEQVLSLTEEWAESMKAVIENNMAKIAETLEKTLTNGLGFDALMDGFDKLNTRQEEYLTKTNQIYETNKLMRTASKALDESDNSIAKQKLKNFIEETKSLQQNTKLSKYELEIQQAKYDLLLAEIALEEAQNAKSVVRMSRDNEGNFGYVYTADQDAIDDAQQGVEDAENRLYNISLEGQQKYTEKYLQAQQEMYDELAALQQAYLNGEIASEEEYERRKEEILNHYLGPEGILTTCSSLYNIAVRTDADATADYWAKDYAQMTQNTEEWNIAVNEYLDDIEVQTQSWRDVSEQANKDVENALNNSAKATENLTDESGELADQLEEEVIPAIEKELDWVAKQTEAYANQRREILDLIEATEEYLRLLDQTIASESSNSTERRDYASELIVGGLTGMDEDEARELAEQRAHKQGLTGKDFDKGVEDNMNIYNITVNASESQRQDLTESFINKKEWDSDTFKDIMGLSSGGYTGAWGPEGKLAFLHEKELVLNQNDTDNILKTVNFVRELVGLIDTQAHVASLLNLSAISGVQTANQVLDQQVSIYAEFPNATDRNEIEEAFNNLINTASQYANRKN